MYFIPYSFLSLLPNSFFACLGLMAGIFGYYLHGLLPLIITVGSGIIFWHYQERASQSWLIFLFFMMAGGLRIAHQIKTYRCFPFEKYKKPQSITGTITGLNTGSNNRLKKCITLYVPAINNYIQLYTKPYALGTVGDTITIKGVQLKPPNNSSYQDYLHKEGILCSLFLEKPTIILNHHPSFCLARILYNCREYLLNTINKKCSYKTFCLFSALFLGEKSRSKQSLEPISDQFKEWGIVHFLARSGLHLVIFVLLWELLLGCIPLNFFYKQCLLFVITMTYFILSWPTVSFMRALIIFILYKVCATHFRPSHFLHTLALTCCIILILNPMQLFFLDFQLTFILTGALAWLALEHSSN